METHKKPTDQKTRPMKQANPKDQTSGGTTQERGNHEQEELAQDIETPGEPKTWTPGTRRAGRKIRPNQLPKEDREGTEPDHTGPKATNKPRTQSSKPVQTHHDCPTDSQKREGGKAQTSEPKQQNQMQPKQPGRSRKNGLRCRKEPSMPNEQQKKEGHQNPTRKATTGGTWTPVTQRNPPGRERDTKERTQAGTKPNRPRKPQERPGSQGNPNSHQRKAQKATHGARRAEGTRPKAKPPERK